MKETFTATQREIVARKMGYEGPMQGFDEFLMSAPSEAQRYSDITTKFSQRMAKGGVVRRYADGGVVPEGQKKPSEIIQEYSTNIGKPPAEMIALVNALMKSGDGLIIQEHEQEMAKLKLEHELKAHRYCQHEWGDSDNDGELECQKCGLLKDSWDESH